MMFGALQVSLWNKTVRECYILVNSSLERKHSALFTVICINCL